MEYHFFFIKFVISAFIILWFTRKIKDIVH